MSTTMFEATVVGEALIDLVPREGAIARLPGGSPLNVAVGLSRLGRRTSLVARVGDDELGGLLREHLTESGVELSALVPAGRTSTAAARLDPKGGATYDFDLDWELPDDLVLPPGRLLHVGSIGSWRAPGAETVRRLVRERPGDQVATLDPNVRPSLIEDRGSVSSAIEALVAEVDLVKLSEEDADWLYPGTPPDVVLDRLLDLGAHVAVITLGPHGAHAKGRGRVIARAAPAVSVADTIGAGDSFMAGLLDAWLERGLPRGDALDDATLQALIDGALAAAAITVSRPGANPPWRSELVPARS